MKNSRLLIAALLCFFAMGALDLVGLATNYFKADMALSNSQAGFIPGLVSVWFLLISIPAGRMMHFLGKRATVLSALLVICPSLIIAFFNIVSCGQQRIFLDSLRLCAIIRCKYHTIFQVDGAVSDGG